MAKYDPLSYVQIANPGKYVSQYAAQLANAQNQLLNWKYDPLQDANYQALAKIYGARGNQAARDTLGDAAALNGGYGTSYAVSAAQQARNQYNQELASMIPDLESNAYNRLSGTYSMLQQADNDAYNRYRDLMADYQWGKSYDTDLYQLKKAASGGGGGGGGRRRRGGGGRGYGGYSSGTDYYSEAQKKIQEEEANKKKNKYKITKNSGQKLVTYGQSGKGGRVVK